MKFIIQDWAGNICFHAREFDSFDDAEEFLCEKLDGDYETDREEYYIMPNETRESKYLDPKDPRRVENRSKTKRPSGVCG